MTNKEKIVYECIKAYDDGHGVPAKSYYMYYCGDKLNEGIAFENIDVKENEFVNVVNVLWENGYLDKIENTRGEDFFTLKQTSNSEHGNLFNSVLDKFAAASEDEIMATASNALIDFFEAVQVSSDKSILKTAVFGAVIGMGGIEVLSDKQKKLVDNIFIETLGCKGDIEPIYKLLLTGNVPEEYYSPIRVIGDMGNPNAGMPLLYYILSFAYIDGTLKADAASKLEEIFSAVLLAQAFRD